MHPASCLTLTTLALLAALPASAADAGSGSVVVTATRFAEVDPGVAANISVITRQDIRSAPAQSLPDLLRSRAGIDVSQLGGGAMGRNATVDMRGFGATATSNTLILIDGLRVNPIDSGTINWSAIALDSVERIEVIRGSGTVLYGDGATGGVINIITNKSGLPVAGVSATVGSYGYRGADLQLANGNDKAYYNLFVSHAEADGYRKNSQQDQQAASGRIGWLLERGEVFTDFAVYKESDGTPGAIFSSAFRNDPRSTRKPDDSEERDGYRIRPGFSYRVNDRLAVEAEVSFDHQKLAARFVSTATASDRVRDTLALTPRLRWRHDLAALPSETVFGFDYYDGKVTSDNSGFANQGAKQESTALYVQNVTRITEKLSLTTGARHQRVRQEAHQDAFAGGFFPSAAIEGDTVRSKSAYDVGLAYAANNWRVYGKTGTTYRFANVDELFGFDAFFNPVFVGDLKPQHGRINEIGGSVRVGAANLRASLYQLSLRDEIGYDGSANVNLDATRRNGAEFEADWKISDAWLAKASYAYTDARFTDGAFSDNAVPLVPRHQANAQITWNSGRSGSYTATARRVGERRFGGDFANAQGMLAAYTTLDLQAVWNVKPLKITAKVLNALDKKYSPFAGYSSFANDTFYYPADARSFFVSGRYDF